MRPRATLVRRKLRLFNLCAADHIIATAMTGQGRLMGLWTKRGSIHSGLSSQTLKQNNVLWNDNKKRCLQRWWPFWWFNILTHLGDISFGEVISQGLQDKRFPSKVKNKDRPLNHRLACYHAYNSSVLVTVLSNDPTQLLHHVDLTQTFVSSLFVLLKNQGNCCHFGL